MIYLDVEKGMEVKVILNEQHSLTPVQEELLNETFKECGWSILPVPAQGWTKDEQNKIASNLEGYYNLNRGIVFVSPVPYLLARLSKISGGEYATGIIGFTRVYLMHNDKREKVQKGDKIIYTVAKDGWTIEEI